MLLSLLSVFVFRVLLFMVVFPSSRFYGPIVSTMPTFPTLPVLHVCFADYDLLL